MKLLIVDDDQVTLDLLREVLEKQEYQVFTAGGVKQALQVASHESIDLFLSDMRMEDREDGLQLLSDLKGQRPNAVVVLMTGFGSVGSAIEAIQTGAFDYLSKPFNLGELTHVLERAARQIESLKAQRGEIGGALEVPVDAQQLLGSSPKMVEVYRTVARATLSTSTVLILGESGTGKELVARAIHLNSSRKNAPFVPVNCGAITESLLESELFGHVKGAYTGAHQDRIGLFSEAHGGTLFLDEIGDLSLSLQVKLLRVLQEGEVRPVGSSQTKKVDVRVVAATHRDLGALVKDGRFREDLFYRLKVIEIIVPPLRSRHEDIFELAKVFLNRAAQKSGKKIQSISDQALSLLERYEWPGNVRELEHQIERAVALTSSTELGPQDFDLLRAITDAKAPVADTLVSPKKESLEEMEKIHIQRILKKHGYNKSKAAEVLGIDRATLYRKAQRYGLVIEGEGD
jgi:two-component system, NtrC family, response regulator AtoC